ncbi:MAG: 4Fe-4S binding protein, partial [Burkholderiaceae bacterium]
VENAFKKTTAVRRDATAVLRPGGLTVNAWLTPIGLPQAGRNILSAAGWEQVRSARNTGSQVFLAMDNSRYPLVAELPADANQVTKLSIRQGGRDFTLLPILSDYRLRLSGRGSGVSADAVPRLFQTQPGTGFDISSDFEVIIEPVRRLDGPISVAFEHAFAIPGLALLAPVLETPQWVKVWQQRSTEIAILVIGLVVLAFVLPMQGRLVRLNGGLPVFRYAYLIFTLGFIGWYGQGQLTIVNITSLLEAIASGQNADFLLADPMAVILWGFVLVTLFIWGRGTFCGWLCPFGAFQELISKLANKLGLHQKTLSVNTDMMLKRAKYVILAVILITVFISSSWTARFVEIEPFKTAISMTFQRSWPYVLWALACLALSLVVYRGYCRYLCPLGACLAVLGRIRLFAWIPRRNECGTPCQTCRYRCGYQAIAPSGKVDYTECFQCLDCVSIHQNDHQCLPLILERKGKKRPPIINILPA